MMIIKPKAVLVLALLCAAPPSAQPQDARPESRPGAAVDARGGPVVDPTRNVLDLVQAAIQRQDDLRQAEAKYQDAMRNEAVRHINELRDAEIRRINELAAQKQMFDLELAKVLRSSVDSASLVLATQVKEVKTDLQVELRALNQFRWETGGRGSGQGEVIGWIVGGAFLIFALIGAIGTIGVVLARRKPAAP